jgi:hypothetical protein
MKLSPDQKKIARAIAVYTLLYPVAMLLAHRIRTGSVDWGDFLVSLLTALIVGALCILFFVVGSHVPTKDDDSTQE